MKTLFPVGVLLTLAFVVVFREQKLHEAGDASCRALEKRRTLTLTGTLTRDFRQRALLTTKTYPGLDIFLKDPWGKALTPGRTYRITGTPRCREPYKNPGLWEDLPPRFRRSALVITGRRAEVVPENSFTWRVGADLWEEWGGRNLRTYPGLRSLFLAVWSGNTAGFSEDFISFYKKTGLMAVLALSGQHVAVGTFLVLIVLRATLYWLTGSRGTLMQRQSRRVALFLPRASVLPLLISTALLATSRGSPSMVRTTAMVIAAAILRTRGLATDFIPWVGTTAALAFIWNPAWIAEPGFILSVVGVSVLYPFLLAPSGWKHGLYLQAAVPFLFLPVQAYYFSEVPWVAPLALLVISPLWNFFWIPCGFLLPWLPFPKIVLELLEHLWNQFVEGHQAFMGWWDTVPVIRPTDGEWLLISVGLGYGLTRLNHCFFSKKQI